MSKHSSWHTWVWKLVRQVRLHWAVTKDNSIMWNVNNADKHGIMFAFITRVNVMVWLTGSSCSLKIHLLWECKLLLELKLGCGIASASRGFPLNLNCGRAVCVWNNVTAITSVCPCSFPGFFIPGFPKLLRFQEHHEKVLKKLSPKVKKHLVCIAMYVTTLNGTEKTVGCFLWYDWVLLKRICSLNQMCD